MKKFISMIMAAVMLMCAAYIAPISAGAYTYDEPNAAEIKYNVEYNPCSETDLEETVTVVQSVDALPSDMEEPEKYNDEFFKDKFLIFLDVSGSGAWRYRVLSVKEGESTFDIDLEMFGDYTWYPADWRSQTILLEADNSHLGKDISVHALSDMSRLLESENYKTTKYYTGGLDIDETTLNPQSEPYIVKCNSIEELKERYTGDDLDQIISGCKAFFENTSTGYLLFVQWVEPTAQRTHEIESAYYYIYEESPVTIKLAPSAPSGEPAADKPTAHCAVLKVHYYLADREFLIEYDDTPKKVVTVDPPTVNIPSGEVPYGTKVTISSANGNQFQYKINGGEWINPFVTDRAHDVTLTIVEDTTLVVKSLIDVVEENTEYIFPEETYTYTIGGCIEPTIEPTIEPAEYPYTINSLKFVSESGGKYDEIPTDTSFIVDIDVTKIAERSGRDYFIAAAYGENGTLVSLNYIKADLPAGTSFSCGVNIPKTDELIETVKAFVWDGLGAAAPLAEGAEHKAWYAGAEFSDDIVIAGILTRDSSDRREYYLDYLNKTVPGLDLKSCRPLVDSTYYDDLGRSYMMYILELNNGSRKRVVDAVTRLEALKSDISFAQPDYIYYPA